MSYLVLARKSRPQFFKDVVGQNSIVRTLQNGLLQDRVAHALIFSGVRGTGKTTLARIMAKALNCQDRQQAEPCSVCDSCRQITEGSSVDLQEVDGASNRGIQEIRELKEKIRFLPTSSRYKIIIIDEVHMLTTEAFNALLKTLEEPPAHVFFMFATTELHKVPVTILSRCQRYELKRIGREELHQHFARLAEGEGVEIDKGALDLIVREAGGSVRDGLSLLDQVFSYCGSSVKVEDVSEVLGLVNQRSVSQLIESLLAKDTASVFRVLEAIYNQGVDLKRLSADLLDWMRSLVICKLNAGSELLDLAEDDLITLNKTASSYSFETLVSMFGLLLEGMEKANFSIYSRFSLELVFIRIIQAGDIVPVSELLSRFDQLLAGVPESALQSVKPQVVPREKPVTSTAVEVRPSPPPEHNTELVPKVEPQKREIQEPFQAQPPSGKEPETTAEQPAAAESMESGSVSPRVPVQKVKDQGEEKSKTKQEEKTPATGGSKKDIRRDWDSFLSYVRDRQPWTSATLQRASSFKRVDNELVIQFEDSADCVLLKTKQYIKPLTEFLLDFFQEELTIRFDVPGEDSCEIAPENSKQPQQERKALANDPLVLTAVEIFNGQVGDIRIGPRFRKAIDQEEKDGAQKGPQE